MLPWTDRKGQFSALKTLTLLGAFLPAIWIAWKFAEGQLGPKPIDQALHETGTWAVRFLLLTLAITPFRLLTSQTRLILIRRMLGLTALAYTLIHLLLYVLQQKGDLWVIVSEIVLRFYLTIGFVSVAAMVALGLTSTDGAIRRLGAEKWNRLHRLIYPLTVLALFHAYLQAKIDVSEEVLLTGIFFALMGVRALRKRGPVTVWRLIVLAFGVALLAMGLEVLWYAAATGIPWRRIFEANFILDLQPRPALGVFILAMLLPLVAALAALLARFSAWGWRNSAAQKS